MSFFTVLELKRASLKTGGLESEESPGENPPCREQTGPGSCIFASESAHQFSGHCVSRPVLGLTPEHQYTVD